MGKMKSKKDILKEISENGEIDNKLLSKFISTMSENDLTLLTEIITENLFIYKNRKQIFKRFSGWLNNGHYNPKPILETGSKYNFIIGKKGNGKSTMIQMLMLIIFVDFGAESIMIRPRKEDFRQGMSEEMFGGVPIDFIKYITGNKYDTIKYFRYHWYLGKLKKDLTVELCEKPFCHRFHVINAPTSIQFPAVRLVMFDEFLRPFEEPGEAKQFMKVVSTISRDRLDLQFFFCGNTVNTNSDYFEQFGLKNVLQQKRGTIEIYNAGLIYIATENCEVNVISSASDYVNLPFDNSATRMITRGEWELIDCPLCPSYDKKDIFFTFFIEFKEDIMLCNIVSFENSFIICIHHKSTPIQDYDHDLIFTLNDDTRINHIRNFSYPSSPIHRIIFDLFKQQKVFYQNPIIYNRVWNYINSSIKKRA